MKKNNLSGGSLKKAYAERIRAIREFQKFENEAKIVLAKSIKKAQKMYEKYMA
jgi:hypothetical protein